MQPLAIVFYERVMPGGQLVNRLQDLKYRVLTVNDISLLAETVKREKPLLLLVDQATHGKVGPAIKEIKSDPATTHVPVIAFAPDRKPDLLTTAQKAGANFTITDSGLVGHLPQMLTQALHLE